MLNRFETDVNNIQALPDDPTPGEMTADELKAAFDKAGADIKEYLNTQVVPAVNGKLDSEAAEAITRAAEQAVQTADAAKAYAQTAQQTAGSAAQDATTAKTDAENALARAGNALTTSRAAEANAITAAAKAEQAKTNAEDALQKAEAAEGAVARKMDKTGGAFSGPISAPGIDTHSIRMGEVVIEDVYHNVLGLSVEQGGNVVLRGIAEPQADNEATPKSYTDREISAAVELLNMAITTLRNQKQNKLVAGPGINLVDKPGGTLISATGGGGGLTPEQEEKLDNAASFEYVDDAVAAKQNIIIPPGIAPGQLIRAKSIAEDGTITEWEAVDMPSGGEKWHEQELTLADTEVTGAYTRFVVRPPEGMRYGEILFFEFISRSAAGTANASVVTGIHDTPAEQSYHQFNGSMNSTYLSYGVGGRITNLGNGVRTFSGSYGGASAKFALGSSFTLANAAARTSNVVQNRSENFEFAWVSKDFIADYAYLKIRYTLVPLEVQ